MKRASDGRYKATCESEIHEEGQPHTYLTNLVKGKRLSKAKYEILLSSKLLKKDAKNICKTCMDKIFHNNNATKEVTDDDDNDDDDGLDRKYMQYLSKKAEEFGNELYPILKMDLNKLKEKKMEDIKDILNHNPQTWCSERPSPLIALLCKLCGIEEIKSANEKQTTLISKMIENIYNCLFSKIVLPNHFIENLLCYSLTNCKSYLNFLSSRSPGGGYTHVCNWLKNLSKQPIEFPDGLVKCVFDNSQKVGKTYLISSTNKVPSSVITSQLYVTLDDKNRDQLKKEFSPSEWIDSKLSETQREALIKNLTEPTHQFRDSRNNQIQWCIDFVTEELKMNNRDIIDGIISDENQINQQRICVKCGCENDVNFRVCRISDCGGKLVKEELDITQYKDKSYAKINPYAAFKTVIPKLPEVKCKTGEPEFVNPNGYHNIVQVLRAIGEKSGIKQYGGGERQWLFVECDGLPSNMIRDIISKVIRCVSCSRCFWGTEAFEGHNCFILNSAEFTKEFGWLIPVYGLLHLEMNLGRAFVKLNWDIFLKCTGHTLNFKTPKALAYLKKGSDHHKLWHLLEILYTAVSLELIRPYVNHCLNKKESPTTDGYWKWNNDVESKNYIYMQQMTFTYLHALMMLRAGVRKSNSSLIRDAIAKFIPIIFSRKHPIYQRILYYEARDRIVAPTEIIEILDKFVSVSKFQRIGVCQGFDALLEELNKDSKSWLTMSGVPTEDQWLRVMRNLDDLNKMKEKLMGVTKSSETEPTYKKEVMTQIFKVRHLFRKSSFLELNDNTTNQTNIESDILDSDLLSIDKLGLQNLLMYLKNVEDGEKNVMDMAFVTSEERVESEKIEFKSIDDIKVIICKQINCLPLNTHEIMENLLKNAKVKSDYVKLYHELNEMIQSNELNEDSENEEEFN